MSKASKASNAQDLLLDKAESEAQFTNLQNDYTDVLESGLLSDCIIRCDDRVWKLHKIIICRRSAFFKAAFCGGFDEAETGELTLHEQDPKIVGYAIRYIYKGNFGFIQDQITPADKGLSTIHIKAYDTYIPLFKLADFLGIESLCNDTLGALRAYNKRKAAAIQRWWYSQGSDETTGAALRPWVASGRFQETFVRCASIAYGLPPTAKYDVYDQNPRPLLPVGIRLPFIELLQYTRFAIMRDRTFIKSLEDIPELMTDLFVAAGAWREAIKDYPFPKTCEECEDSANDVLNGDRHFETPDVCNRCYDRTFTDSDCESDDKEDADSE